MTPREKTIAREMLKSKGLKETADYFRMDIKTFCRKMEQGDCECNTEPCNYCKKKKEVSQ